MDRKTLLRRQEKFHELYQKRLASANGMEEAMARDLAQYDEGIELLLQGVSSRACLKLLPHFTTTYSWIRQATIPRSFKDYFALRKKVNLASLEASPSFAYIVGAYQAKVDKIHSTILTIEGSYSLEHEVEKCFRSLNMASNRSKIAHKSGRPNDRIRYYSLNLMSRISKITENNSRIPQLFFIPEMLIAYISGFFDARASPSFSGVRCEGSSIVRKYPRITISKYGNVPLMSSVNSVLHFLGIASIYDSQNDPRHIYINALGSVKKVIDLGLFRCPEKRQKLIDLYTYWTETKELDYRCAYQRQKEMIIRENKAKIDKYVEQELEDDE